MSENLRLGPEFQPVEDLKELKTYLREANQTLAPLLMWTKDHKYSSKTLFAHYKDNDPHFYVRIIPGFDSRKFVSHIIKEGLRDCLFNLTLASASVFFKAEFVSIDQGALKFKTPEKVFKVQRRASFRYPIPEKDPVYVKIPDPLNPGKQLSKKVLDVSVGGLCFVIASLEKNNFYSKMLLTSIHFTLLDRPIICNAEIRYLSDLPAHLGRPGVKVGLMFKDLTASDSKFLSEILKEEERKYYSKFM